MPSKKILESGEVFKFVTRERVNKEGQKETHKFGVLIVDGCVNTEVLFHMGDVDARYQRIWQPRKGDVVVFHLSDGYKRLYANDVRPKIYAGTCTSWNNLVKGKGALTCCSLSNVLLYHDELVNTDFLSQGDRVRFAVNVRVTYDQEGQEIRRYKARMVRLLKEKDDSSSSCSSSTSSSTSMMSTSSSTSSKVTIVRRSSKKLDQFADKRTKSSSSPSPSFSRSSSLSSTPSESSFSFGLSSSQSGEFWDPRKPSQPTSRPPTRPSAGPSSGPSNIPRSRRHSRRSNSSYTPSRPASRSPSPPPVVNPSAYGPRTHINVQGTVTFVDPKKGAFGFLYVKNLQDCVVDNGNGDIDDAVNGKDKKGADKGRKVWFSARQLLGRAKVMVKRRAKVRAKAMLKAGDFVITDLCCDDEWRKETFDNNVAVNIRRDFQAEIQRINAQIAVNHKAAPKTLEDETYLKKELKSLRKALAELRVGQKKDQLGELIVA